MTDDDAPRSPLADEATRLLGVVQEWTRQNFPAAADAHSAAAPVCTWCPLCQFMAVLRGDRPEVTEQVTAAGTALASALKAVLDAATSGTAPTANQPEPSPRVQRIDLGGPE